MSSTPTPIPGPPADPDDPTLIDRTMPLTPVADPGDTQTLIDPTQPLPDTSHEAATVTLREQRHSILAMLQGPAMGKATADLPAAKYKVIGELGKGGVGQVLKVVDRDLKREVAMKTLLPTKDGAEGPTRDALIRFIEEAQATGQLEHPNIVPVHDLGVDREGRVYFTLKYVQGVSLQKVLGGRNKKAEAADSTTAEYTPLRMIEILIAVCQAIAYAHSKGVIHRDLKPANVMLGKYGEVLVMDWGLAKVIGSRARAHDAAAATIRVSTSRATDESLATMEGSIAGTPAYMSPEQAAGRIAELDARTDVYSLGAILYEILTGAPPYRGADPLRIVRDVVNGPPAPLKNQKGSAGFAPIPRELAGICQRAMSRKPDDRYPGAGAMRDDLRAYLENLPVRAAPDTRLQHAGKWIRRNRRPVQSALTSAAAVLLLVVSGLYAWRTWTLYSLIAQGETALNTAREQNRYKANEPVVNPAELYSGQAGRNLWTRRAALFRQGLQGAIDPLRRVMDLAPTNTQARSLMAETQMELWRLAAFEENAELARVTRLEVERFAPDPATYATELDGLAPLEVGFDAPDAEVFVFRFETLNVTGKNGAAQPDRSIPVPYNIKARRSETAFLAAEQARILSNQPTPVDRHSIFNLEPTPSSRAGQGSRLLLPALLPGSYMLLVRAPGRIDVRIAVNLDRLTRVRQNYLLPKTEDSPPGFFYMAGGAVKIGGDTAGAPSLHSMTIKPAWIYHDEMSMGDYEAFLHSLVKSGKKAEATQRLPKDFGKNLATLSPDGHLLPVEAGDAALFLKSPVRGVSYADARAYVAWRADRDGLPYRLPEDWEWEAACRGTDGRKYSWGETPGKGLAVVTQGYGDTGSGMSWRWEDYKDESPWGIHNLAGGAAEWTGSLFDPAAKPADPVFGQYAIRGNAWALPPVGLECAFRTSGRADYFHPTIGFRLALDHPYVRTGPAAPAKEPAATHAH